MLEDQNNIVNIRGYRHLRLTRVAQCAVTTKRQC